VLAVVPLWLFWNKGRPAIIPEENQA